MLNTQLSTGSSGSGSSVDKIMKGSSTYLGVSMDVRNMIPARVVMEKSSSIRSTRKPFVPDEKV